MQRLLILAFFLVLIFSCRSTRKIQSAINAKDTTTVILNPDVNDSLAFLHQVKEKIKANHIEFKSFFAKVKVDYEDSKGKSYDFTAFLQMRKDSAIWISINKLGIEAFRVLITRDSVKVMNKLDREVKLRSVSFLQEVAQLPFDYFTLQDLIVGNPVYLDSNIVALKRGTSLVSILTSGNVFKNLATFDTQNYYLQHSKLDDLDPLRNRTADLAYDSYDQEAGRPFADLREITITERTKLTINLKFNQVKFDQPVSFSFNIPKNYKLK
jgi:hypothetical protein